MTLINEISELAVTELSSEHVFATAVERICEVLGFTVGAVYAGQPLTVRLACGRTDAHSGMRVPSEFAQVAMQARRPFVCPDLNADGIELRLPWVPSSALAEAVIPVIYQGQCVGVLDFYSTDPAVFDDPCLETLTVLSRLLAVSIAQEQRRKEENTPQKLKRAYQRLQEFADFKDQILQNISHELRTPLTLVKGYLELMVDGEMGTLLPDQVENLKIVLHKVDDVVRIVDRTVSLSPLDGLSHEVETIRVGQLLEDVMDLFRRRGGPSSVQLRMQPIDGDLCLEGDREQIQQVCYNILDNSVKFSPNGGAVTVWATEEDAYVHMAFRDEGVGIPRACMGQIFDTFYQVDSSSTRRFGGLGLGLAVVHRVVQAHRGKVWAESGVNRGTVFHVLLPQHVPPRSLFRSVVPG